MVDLHSLQKRALSLFQPRRIVGIAIAVFGLVNQAFHWGWFGLDVLSRLDTLWRIVEATGGTPGLLATIVSSWQFNVGLIVAGTAYTIFVGEPEKGTQRHPAWPYIAASVLVAAIAMVVSVTLYGFFELQLRAAYDQGRAGAPRGSPGENNPSKPQIPLYGADQTIIAPDQARILLQELPKLRELTLSVYFTTVPMDNDAYNRWRDYDQIFKRSGINTQRSDQVPRGPDEEGLMLEVKDPANLSAAAQRLREAFVVANIPFRLTRLPDGILPPTTEFAIFIGPRPIRWQ